MYDPRRSIPDEEWIRYACSKDLLIIKKDKNIRRNPSERAAYIAGNARGFLLSGNETKVAMARSILVAFDEIEHIVRSETPPYIYFIDSNGKVHQKKIPGI